MTPAADVSLPHAFEHGGDVARPGQRRALGWALGVNIALLVAELIGGFVFGSLALLAEAAHLVSDVAGLAILGCGWMRAGSVASIATAVLVLWTGWGLLRDSTHVLMEGTPRNLDLGGNQGSAGRGL